MPETLPVQKKTKQSYAQITALDIPEEILNETATSIGIKNLNWNEVRNHHSIRTH